MKMLINTTFSVDSDCIDGFKAFVTGRYAAAAKDAGMERITLLNIRVRPELNMLTGKHASCFALQMFAPNRIDVDKFANETEAVLFEELFKQFGNGVTNFRTVMDVEWEND